MRTHKAVAVSMLATVGLIFGFTLVTAEPPKQSTATAAADPPAAPAKVGRNPFRDGTGKASPERPAPEVRRTEGRGFFPEGV